MCAAFLPFVVGPSRPSVVEPQSAPHVGDTRRVVDRRLHILVLFLWLQSALPWVRALRAAAPWADYPARAGRELKKGPVQNF